MTCVCNGIMLKFKNITAGQIFQLTLRVLHISSWIFWKLRLKVLPFINETAVKNDAIENVQKKVWSIESLIRVDFNPPVAGNCLANSPYQPCNRGATYNPPYRLIFKHLWASKLPQSGLLFILFSTN